MSRPLDRGCQGALMFGASACLTTWANLAPICDVATQLLVVFIVDVFHPVGAEVAYTWATISSTTASASASTTTVRASASATAIATVAAFRATILCSAVSAIVFCLDLRLIEWCVVQFSTPRLFCCVLDDYLEAILSF